MISEKIVVVDDDPRVHSSLKVVLFEYELVSFVDPCKALEYLTGPHEIRLAIIDVFMKGLNGLELLEKIKNAKSHMAVMIITGQGSQDIIVDALRSHADDFIEKPFDIVELKNRVRTILREKGQYNSSYRDQQNRAERIRRFIEMNPNNASLAHVAREMSLSPQYLGRMFAQKDSLGFRRYKLKVRMEKAIELLTKTSLDVSEIAYKLGYENPESFMRIFKRYTKSTPTAYRERNRTERRTS